MPYTHTYFQMPAIRQVWLFIQWEDYAFSIYLKDAYLHIPIAKYHLHFLHFIWHHKPNQRKVFWAGYGSQDFHLTYYTHTIPLSSQWFLCYLLPQLKAFSCAIPNTLL